jgi:hypothetical protein
MPGLENQLLLAALFVSVGFVGGALVCLWWVEHQKENPTSEQKAAAKKPADTAKDNFQEVVRLLRDRSNGKMLIEVQGKTYTNTKTLSPAQRQELVKLLPEWAAWMRSDGEISTQPLSKAIAKETEDAPKTLEDLPATRMVADVMPPSQPNLRPIGTGPLLTQPMMDTAAVKDVKPSAPKSMVAQINDILQERLPGTPLEGKGIRIMEDFRHDVVVWVGQDRFPGIDAVPDPEIQKAIRSASSEWEQLTEKNKG